MKKYLFLFISLSFLPMSLYAFPFPEKIKKSFLEKVKKNTQVKKMKEDCTDFSGNWEGMCTFTSNGEVNRFEARMKIEQQGCFGFNVTSAEFNKFYSFGALESTIHSSSISVVSMTQIIAWKDSNKDVLVGDLSGKGRLFNSDYRPSFENKGIIKIEDGKLITRFEGRSTKTDISSCEYVKK